jgi:hypothetical protein
MGLFPHHRPEHTPGLRFLRSSVGVAASGVSATASKSSCVGSGRAPRWLPMDTALSGDRVWGREQEQGWGGEVCRRVRGDCHRSAVRG